MLSDRIMTVAESTFAWNPAKSLNALLWGCSPLTSNIYVVFFFFAQDIFPWDSVTYKIKDSD